MKIVIPSFLHKRVLDFMMNFQFVNLSGGSVLRSEFSSVLLYQKTQRSGDCIIEAQD